MCICYMVNVIGISVLVLFSIVIITIRKNINNSNNTLLKTATSVGDTIIWMRFLFGILFFFFIIVMFSLVGKDTIIRIG